MTSHERERKEPELAKIHTSGLAGTVIITVETDEVGAGG